VIDRRSFAAALAASLLSSRADVARRLRAAEPKSDSLEPVEAAHRELARRFIDGHGILLDYAALDGSVPRPTPEECRAHKPNALAWWTPVENGSMFNGMYLDGVCARWKATGAEADRAEADRLVRGLEILATLSDIPGFVARGVATDGLTPYPMGSNDQTGPWLYGIWRYLSTFPVDDERHNDLVRKFLEVAAALEANEWRMPCAAGAPAKFRGTFAGFAWEHAPRLLFLLKAAYRLSGDERWHKLYLRAIDEAGGESNRSRRAIVEQGMVFHKPEVRESWTGASGVIALRALWEMEDDPPLKDAYARGLAASAVMAAPGIELYRKFDNESRAAFLYDWRELNAWWRPQKSEADAVAVALDEAKQFGKLSPRRGEEFRFVREPLFAAWVVTMCPDRKIVEPHRAAITAAIAHYRYDRLYYSQFFPAVAAWHRLQSRDA
jgi:hypothetical protein